MHCLSSEWFTCGLLNRKEHAPINDYDSNLAVKKLGDPEGSVLDILLFVIYSNDFKQNHKILWISSLCQCHYFTCLQ